MKSIIFDLNGVFIKGEYLTSRLEKKYKVSTEESLTALKSIMDIVRQPNAPSIYSLCESYFEEWGVELDETEFLDWYFSGESLDEEMYEFALSLKQQGYNIYFLSNNFRERTDYYRNNLPKLFQLPKKSYFSWETGLVKPNVEVYKHILNENSLDPTSTYYIDDSEKNLEVAGSLGVNTFLMKNETTVDDLREFIASDSV